MHQLCLLFMAAVLPGSASVDQGVTLKCNSTVEAKVGDDMMLRCAMNFSNFDSGCEVLQYIWSKDSDKSGNVICSNKMNENTQKDAQDKPYTCGVDNITHVLYLNIPSVKKDMKGIYYILMSTDCGTESSTATVGVNIHEKSIDPEPTNVYAALVGIVVTLAVVGIVVYLAKTQRGKRMVSHVWNKMTQRHPNNADADPESEAASKRLTHV